ncbi:MAG: autotransporter domain-containing protein [Alphaproteobacteria bacterium]|nr:autotransporter domain-containing protein [Alphaproteobacteria bacterium]
MLPAPIASVQSFAHSEPGAADTRVNVNISGTQPNQVGQNSEVGATVTCSCAPARGTLTINKVAIGGNDTFPITATLGANAPLDFSITTVGGNGQNSQVVPTGTYTVAETPPAGWILDSIVCGGQPTDQAVVTQNTTTVCTVTNRKLASVTIKKQTINGTGAFDFAATTVPGGQNAIAGFTETTNAQNVDSAGTTLVNLVPGDYTFTETPPVPGWTLTNLSCTGTGVSNFTRNGLAGSFTLADGAVGECIYENTRALGNLEVTKVAAGGGATPFDFEIRDDQNALLAPAFQLVDGQTETRNGIPTGQYTITETNLPAGWSLDTISACGTRNGDTVTVDVTANQTTSCTFTNVNQVGSIKITKETIGGNDNFDFEVRDAGNAVVGSANGLANGDMQTITPLAPGNFTISEINIPAGWTLTGVDCGQLNGNSVDVTVIAGQTTECKFTNTLAPASLTIVKDVPGNGDNTSFMFSNTGPQAPAAFQLADGQSRNFTTAGTYVITETQQDGYKLTALSCTGAGANGQGDSTSIPGRSATINLDPGDNITCTFRNVRQTGTITVRKVTVGGDGDFSFQVTGQSGFNLSNGENRKFTGLTIGQYTVRETNIPDGWKLQSVSCTGGGNKQGNAITVDLSVNQAITCTFTNFKKRDDRMREVTRLFIHRRVDNLLTHGPDRARLLRRLQPQDPPACGLKDDCSQPPPLKLGAAPTGTGAAPRIGGVGTPELPAFGNQAFGNQAFGNPAYGQQNSGVLFANEEDDQPWNPRGGTNSPLLSSIMGQLSSAAGGSSSFKFGTSLSELRESGKAAQLQEEQKKLQEAGLDYNGQMYHMPKNALHQRLDIWVEGQFSGYNDSTGGLQRDGNFRVLYVGADYAIAPGILVGALVQVDDTRENIDDPTLLGEVEGTGWMAGPYIGIKLTDTLYFDARAAWGTSDNDIWLQDAAAGWRSGAFETERWLANANLTGNYQFGNWRLSPQVGLAYGQESYDTYFNSLGQAVDGGEARIGRVTGGAEVGYQFRHSDGSVLEPHIGIKGIWNFQTDDLFVNGVLVDTDESRAQIEGGLLYRTPSGMAVRGALAYDGIGADDFESYTGQLWVNIPLN